MAAIIAIIISVVALLVSALAAFTSTEILRIQLYNRRFDVYVRAVRFHHVLQTPKESYEEGTFSARQTDFIIAVRESRFLFKASSGVFEMLLALNDASFTINGFRAHGKELVSDPAHFQAFMAEVEKALRLWNDQFDALENSIAPYLNFHYTTVIELWYERIRALVGGPS